MAAPTRARLLNTATTFITNFNKESPEAVIEIRSPSCIHEIKPDSFAMTGKYTNDEYLTMWRESILAALPKGIQLTVDDREPVIDEQTRKVVLYVKSRAESVAGVYENTYVWNLTVSEDGTMIDHILEFVDSKTATDFTQKIMAAIQQTQQGNP
ncbi:uncharacterized protein Z518_08937 [Rhinocladiella mackenziei CBS 650.93]|uniref:SnoaL-like domain-containing protein n=1 Tax=Rhinocladiella mackenziei CBS 650.93 TaxID=1442369 RepID=A0A0D2FGS1_9EURO|nr:uncharacterized protein Z518_08937 [Rhinocladiella mackenziei CBS 650.93]KIX01212.1 hypothetical protein Z518_08937 [Rhinocladiella mackenziei CBS 650.93]